MFHRTYPPATYHIYICIYLFVCLSVHLLLFLLFLLLRLRLLFHYLHLLFFLLLVLIFFLLLITYAIVAYLHWRREATANYLRRQLRYTHRNRCSTISHQHQLYCAMQRRRRMLDVLEMNQPSVLQPLHVRPSIHQPLRPSPSFAYTVRIPLLPPTLSRKVRFQTRNCWESLLDKCHPGNRRIMQLQPDHDDNDTHIVGQK